MSSHITLHSKVLHPHHDDATQPASLGSPASTTPSSLSLSPCGEESRTSPLVGIRFDRGTIEVIVDGGDSGAGSPDVGHPQREEERERILREIDLIPNILWDARSRSLRIPAYRFSDLIALTSSSPSSIIYGDLRVGWEAQTRPRDIRHLELRGYQAHALASWNSLSRRGTVVMPTGAGKTRLAIAAICETGLPTAILCPTKALAATWVEELKKHLGPEEKSIGLVGDGERRIERITVITFESAFRHMDSFGDRFGLLIVDEVHHFGSGARIEALEASAAIARLGLTATAPENGSEGAHRIGTLVGPVAFEIGYADLVGDKHLAPVTMVRIPVRLDADERIEYDRRMRAFLELRRTIMRVNPHLYTHDVAGLLRAIGRTPEGRRALRDRARALQLASFPRAKRKLLRSLLARHGGNTNRIEENGGGTVDDGSGGDGGRRAGQDKALDHDRTIVFTAFAENAYDVARDALIPAITAQTSTRERREILDAFRDGRIRAIASARVLNEGIDVPDARVAIIVAGTLGAREHIQRIGRVLRPRPGKVALVYELVTIGTADAWRSYARTRNAPFQTH